MDGNNTIQDSFVKPAELLSQFHLSPGMRVADFGSGHGYFAVPLAKAVEPDGMVYALDIQKSALEAIKSTAQMAGVSNVQPSWVNLEAVGGTQLGNESMDFVILKNVLYQTQKKLEMLKEAKRVLKNGQRIAIVDWRPEKSRGIGPQEGWLLSSEDIRPLVESIGFTFEKELTVDPYHFGFLFIKK
ncbi:MAG: hypothetical protein COU81_03155 [Candidatus Portnoybacteria bacterium CG10_big_fil_rev_8_21_14_0_10_36_7]|uniref:Methyltransferase domain-containing protein n=1 Tax=Candidatus Portnoybacteria bacterium CG10_big_fil_rev_8_21_14_0_10_36_7 TaxID=1974812 RepID=A0A2M8KDK4_9BACT|nr:MAG: hypothetical protein COU81_03155 [Candidatus Portnoybacteria bacterium CG10_big_fil_rev_8_21_14_0_10_36_7]